MAGISEEADDAAGSAESADLDDLAADADTTLASAHAPPPDVGATRAALDAVVMEKDHVHVENNFLFDHLMRLMMLSGSGDNMQTIQLDSLEELDEVYEEVEENKGFIPAVRTSSSRVSFNIPQVPTAARSLGPTPMDGSAHEMAQGLSMEERCDIAVAETKSVQDQMNIYRPRMMKAELRIGEIRRDISGFRRKIMAETAEKGAKSASFEHVLKCLQQKIKTTLFTIGKLGDCNASLHGNIAKTEATLEIKKDLSDVLHSVDFDQLAIQKQQLETRLRGRDKEVFWLKGENLKTEATAQEAFIQFIKERDASQAERSGL